LRDDKLQESFVRLLSGPPRWNLHTGARFSPARLPFYPFFRQGSCSKRTKKRLVRHLDRSVAFTRVPTHIRDCWPENTRESFGEISGRAADGSPFAFREKLLQSLSQPASLHMKQITRPRGQAFGTTGGKPVQCWTKPMQTRN